MKDEELNKLRLKSLEPHLAREIRKYSGTIFGNQQCQHCQGPYGNKNRQRTAYHIDENNFAILCPACQIEADMYWDDMWAEYYNGLGI